MSVVGMGVVEDFADDIVSVLGDRVERVVLFGSYARGEELPGSDVDVLVVLSEVEEGDRSEVLDVAGEFFWSDDVFFSPKVISKTDLEDKQDFSLFQTIEDEGVEVYG